MLFEIYFRHKNKSRLYLLIDFICRILQKHKNSKEYYAQHYSL